MAKKLFKSVLADINPLTIVKLSIDGFFQEMLEAGKIPATYNKCKIHSITENHDIIEIDIEAAA